MKTEKTQNKSRHNVTKFKIMVTVYKAEGAMTAKEIAEKLGWPESRVMKAMAHYRTFYKKYFFRYKAKGRRAYKYRLTPFGISIMDQYITLWKAKQPLKIKPFTPLFMY